MKKDKEDYKENHQYMMKDKLYNNKKIIKSSFILNLLILIQEI
jgi:hypothetical protein